MTDPEGPAEARAGTPTERVDRTEVVVVTAATVLAVVLLYARLPFAAEQFWAEDGRDFFGDAFRDGIPTGLRQSDAGYYLFVPRIGGALAALAPLRDAAAAMWWWVAVVHGWMVATVLVSSRAWLRSWPARLVVALSLVLLPVLGQESIGTAANLQFSLLFVSVVVLVSRPRTRGETANGVVVLVATGMTTPLAAALVVFAALRVVWARSWRPDALVIGWLVGVAVQWGAILVTSPEGRERAGQDWATVVKRIETAAFRQNLVPFEVERYVGPVATIGSFVALLALAVVCWRRGERDRGVVLVAVPAFGTVLLAALGLASGAANRYVVVAGLCAVWGVMMGAEVVGDVLPARWSVPRWGVPTLAAVVLLLSSAAGWTPSETRRSGATWADGLDAATERCREDPDRPVRIRLAPLREDKPDQWSVLLTCAEVTAG